MSSVYNSALKCLAVLNDWRFSFQWTILQDGQDARAEKYRKTIWPDISGKVLELGPGYASALEHLPHKTTSTGKFLTDPDIIQSYTALEPNPFMFDGLQKNAENHGFRVEYDRQTCTEDTYQDTVTDNGDLMPFSIVRGTLDDSEDIPQSVLDNAPYDTIVTSFSLCTARNPEESIRNIVRLLKPGGAYIFIEHILHPPSGHPLIVDGDDINGTFWNKMQMVFDPLWSWIAHGCHITRETEKWIADTPGWESVQYGYARVGGDILSYFVPMAFGKAVKAL
ncbi:hypothetical protein IWW50_000892 [Coemansia erecta]|nr:hypothetical protein IWW50_000892 [Coemansia erecta]